MRTTCRHVVWPHHPSPQAKAKQIKWIQASGWQKSSNLSSLAGGGGKRTRAEQSSESCTTTEPAVITRASLALSVAMPLLVIWPSHGFASTSFPSIFGGGGGGGNSGADTAAAAAVAVTLDEAETANADAVLLHVEPEVTSATVDIEKATAFVWTTPEAKATKGWQKQLGEKLANHLTTCGFLSHLHDEDETEQS